jgi:hypothetical protein
MSKATLIKLTVAAAIILAVMACLAMRHHNTVTVVDASTGQPVAGAYVALGYPLAASADNMTEGDTHGGTDGHGVARLSASGDTRSVIWVEVHFANFSTNFTVTGSPPRHILVAVPRAKDDSD